MVKDASKYGLAIQTLLGRKLYNWIVADKETATMMGSRRSKCFDHPVTVLPLDSIKGKEVDRNKLKIAQDLAGHPDLVQAAIDLIEYDPALEAPMKFAFSDIFVCANLDIANEVAFDKRIRVKCFTLDGDIVSPAGILTGGSRREDNKSNLLEVLDKLNELKADADRWREVERRARELSENAKKFRFYQDQLEKTDEAFLMCQQRLETSSAHRLLEEVKALESEVNTANEETSALQQSIKTL